MNLGPANALPPGMPDASGSSLEDLKKAVQRYDSLIAAVPTMVYHADPNGVPTWFSSDFYDYTGLRPAALADWRQVIEKVIHPDDLARITESQQQSVKLGMPFEAEVRLKSKDGRYRWQLNRAVPIRDDTGRVVEWVGTTTDIHGRKLMEDELRRSNQVKDEFLGFVSHELRSPLSSIFGSARLLQSRGENLSEEERQELLQTVVQESERLNVIIDELLTIARTELSGRVRKTRVNVREMVEALLSELKMTDRQVEFSREDCSVLAEPVMLRQVLSNLLSNAGKYSAPESPITFSVQNRQDAYVIEVADRGPGVPGEDLDRIFDPFYRSPVASRTSKGTGLGLAVSRRLIEAQSGSISAHSRPGGGLLVRIELPARQRRSRGATADADTTLLGTET